MKIAVLHAESRRASGLADYARLLERALLDLGHDRSDAPEVTIFNYAPYSAGVYLGWLRGVRAAEHARRSGRRLVVVFHEVFVRPDRRLRMRIFELAQRWALRRLDALADATVVADHTRANAVHALDPSAKRPTVIPVGPNIPVPSAPERARSSTAVLFGLLHPDRDVETVIRAAALLQSRIPELQLRIVGELGDDPRRAAAIARLVDELSAPVTFDGYLGADRVAEAFSSSRAFISTYVSAITLGSGTIAAAFAYALPVVVYEDADVDARLLEPRTVLVAGRDPDQLANVLADALGPDGDAVGYEGRRLYEAELAWPRIAARFDTLLRSLVDTGA